MYDFCLVIENCMYQLLMGITQSFWPELKRYKMKIVSHNPMYPLKKNGQNQRSCLIDNLPIPPSPYARRKTERVHLYYTSKSLEPPSRHSFPRAIKFKSSPEQRENCLPRLQKPIDQIRSDPGPRTYAASRSEKEEKIMQLPLRPNSLLPLPRPLPSMQTRPKRASLF